MIFLVWVVTKTLYFAYLLHLKCTFKGWPMHNSLMEICNDGSKFMSLLWHISVFVFAFQYFTQPFPKDVALSFTTFAHFQKKISLTVTNLSTRQPDGCKAKHYSPSAFTIITRSYLSQCLGQHCLFWEAERGSWMTAICHVSQSLTKTYNCVSHHYCLQRSGMEFPAFL